MGKKITTEEFINRCKLIHGDKYDYSLTEYRTLEDKVKIICKKHGEFNQSPNNHLKGHGCSSCAGSKKLTTNDFIYKANLIHNNKYDYSLVEYINVDTKIKIICKEHGIFKQTPYKHINNKQGCYKCNESKGEREIRQYLNENNIRFIPQNKFTKCVDINPLPFDFYLPDYNMCIEYDGEQHYKSVEHWGGLNGLLDRQKKDKIKTDYCLINNIKLIRIKYNQKINDILLVIK
jgi:very-short-patch-repair endonuclease